MLGYLRRLATTGAAYQAADVLSRVFAVITLPLYTRYLTPADYGVAETLVAGVVLLSIPLRLGLSDAFVRFWYLDDDAARRDHVLHATFAAVAVISTVVCGVAVFFSGPLSELVLGFRDATVMAFALLGLWAFANLEVVKGVLRVEERWRAFMAATIGNVLLTVALTIVLVVFRHEGATGLVAGNFVASAVAVLAMWVFLRSQLGLRFERTQLRALLRWGWPTVPADASVFALNVVDRGYLLRAESARAAGLYALSVKLASVVIIAVRGFQYAWPPLAYSVTDDEEASRLYGLVTTWFVVVTGYVVCGVTLLGRWGVRLLAEPRFYDAYRALPWVALGWALYGLFLVFVVVAGRLQLTARNVPAAVAGLAVNVLVLVLLVPPLGISGAGIALCCSYAVMLLVLWLLTRRRFRVAFELGRLARVVAVLAVPTVAAELLLPTSGVAGFFSRAAVAAVLPVLLAASGFLSAEERAWLRRVRRRPPGLLARDAPS